jgi:hypothetical protein
MYQCIVFQFLCIMIYLYEYILNSYFQSLAALVLGYKSINVSMYRQPVPTYYDIFVCLSLAAIFFIFPASYRRMYDMLVPTLI